MTKSRFSPETHEVFARYTIDDAALSRAYDEAFKRAFIDSRESDTPAARDLGKRSEALLARARDGLDALMQKLGARFAATEASLSQSLAKTRAQSEAIAALVREGERPGVAGAPHGETLAALREHEVWSRTMKQHLRESAQSARSTHRLLLEAYAYAFSSVARRGDRAEGYAFVLKSLARLTADFAESALLLSLGATLREWCGLIDRRLKETGSGGALHAEALELYAEIAELGLEQLDCE